MKKRQTNLDRNKADIRMQSRYKLALHACIGARAKAKTIHSGSIN